MKKSMMQVIVVAAAVCMLAACGGKAEETKTPQTTEATTTAETIAPVTAEAETMAEETKTIEGEIIDAAMSTIIIKTEDGAELIFSKEDAEADLKDGLIVGNFVVLEYTGEIVGEDTTGAVVLKISDKK